MSDCHYCLVDGAKCQLDEGHNGGHELNPLIGTLRAQLTAERERADRAEAHVGRLEMDAKSLVRQLAAAKGDVERLDWLEKNLAYVMMVNPQNNVMYSLLNKGNGWDTGELRAAIDAARKKEKS